jgi:TetR/AcrR family transcriptional regulator, fatty acid metabolism regulator protein
MDRSVVVSPKRPSVEPSEKGRARREQILDAAFSTFAHRGFRETSMDEIATAASTSKGGVYFHFPTKETIFRELMRTTADRLADKVARAVAAETEPIARAEAGIRTVLLTFAGHRTTARLLLIDAVGAGRTFQTETALMHARFTGFISSYLEEAEKAGVIPELDAETTARAWFGALNEIVSRWLVEEKPGRLEDSYPVLRALLLRSVGVPEERIAAGDPAWRGDHARVMSRTADERRER